MLQKILLGYAGDRAGRDAATLAAELASLSDGELTVVFPYHPLFTGISAEVAEKRVRSELAALLGDCAALRDAHYRWSKASWPIRALHELAEYDRSELIVFGAAPERPERRHLSLMERIVHGAPCAVALAPAGYADRRERGIRRVGVGFADTVEGSTAISLAQQVAARADASVRVIACAGLSPTLAAYASASPELPRAEAEIEAEMRTCAERAIAELAPGDRTTLDVRRGDPCRLLIEGSQDLDLLILGSRAYGPLRHALLGSVSAGVMRGAHCPVLVSPRGPALAQAPPTRGAEAIATS
jgi:nucleotide-binding universal stress UspA family protein